MAHKCRWCGGKRSGQHLYHRTIEQLAKDMEVVLARSPQRKDRIFARAVRISMKGIKKWQ